MNAQTLPAVEGPVDRQVRPLRPYMCWAGDPEDGAVLAWAHTAQEARKLAYPAIADWTDIGFIDVRARRLKKHPEYMQTLKLKDGPHVNADPPVCPVCELWGNPPRPEGNGCWYCGGGWGGLVASKSEQRAEARQAALEKDAARYRWLKSRKGLTLRSEKQPNLWKRMDGTEFSATHSLAEGGTQYAPADSLDALIDAAMLAARIRDT